MNTIFFSYEAKKEFKSLENTTKKMFAKHIVKMETNAPRKRLRNTNFYVEQVGQGRVVCLICTNRIEILRIFATHKEYERWYKRLD
jgi:mRNA-degrading endonuclease RelE of RelBE toxin-antitoxin system